MKEGLYFIPILATALQERDLQRSLEEAFLRIEAFGQQDNHREGYRNFLQFVAEAIKRSNLVHQQGLRMQVLEQALQSNLDSVDTKPNLRGIEEDVQLKRDCETLGRVCGQWESRVPPISIQLCRDGQSVAEVTFSVVPTRRTIGGVGPGRYELRLCTGRIIWTGTLNQTDLVWAEAYGQRKLDLAAQDGDLRNSPTREIALRDEGVILRLFAGPERGSLEIELMA